MLRIGIIGLGINLNGRSKSVSHTMEMQPVLSAKQYLWLGEFVCNIPTFLMYRHSVFLFGMTELSKLFSLWVLNILQTALSYPQTNRFLS